MLTKKITSFLVVAAIIGTTFTACKKDKTVMDEEDNDTSAAADNALAEGNFNDVNNMADQAADGSLSSYRLANAGDGILSVCATVKNDTTVTPHVLTIDFGTANCLCKDGRYRRGKIIVSYVGHYRETGHVHTISFADYFVDDNQIMGTKTVINNGANSAGNITFTVQVDGKVIKANNGGTVIWKSERVREWIEGSTTPVWNDDVYLVTGSASGTSATGNNFTLTILHALRKEIGCRHFVSGQISLAPDNKAVRLIDYGNGVCDNEATVTINGKSHIITLK
jgi:hypothetical protein